MSTLSKRSLSIAAMLTVGVAGNAAPASAQGFFEQLFGGGVPAQAPVYAPPPSSPFDPGQDLLPGQPMPQAHRHQRLADAKPILQKPTDLMHDKTLQAGDAVMMKDGLHVYTGSESATHSRRQFVALDETRQLPKAEKLRLASFDPTKADNVQEARSATEIVEGYKITDARGRSVRYVGP